MKVFIFDLLAHGGQPDHLKQSNELPYPLSGRHFWPEVAARPNCRGWMNTLRAIPAFLHRSRPGEVRKTPSLPH